MKKILATILAVAMVLSLMPMALTADNANAGIKIVTKVNDDNTVTATVQMKLPEGSLGVTTVQTILSYNSTILSLADTGGVIDSALASTPLVDNTGASYTFMDLKQYTSGSQNVVYSTLIIPMDSNSNTPSTAQHTTNWQNVYSLTLTVNAGQTFSLNAIDFATTAQAGAVTELADNVSLNFIDTQLDTDADLAYLAKGTPTDGKDTMTAAGTGTVEEGPTFVKGDVTGDDIVSAADVTALLRHTSKIELITDPVRLQASDVDDTVGISASDVTKLLRFTSKIIPSLD